MIKYLIPLLIAFSGGRLYTVYVVVSLVPLLQWVLLLHFPDTPMLIGAMIMGPLLGWLMKKVDDFLVPRTPQGFEMLFNNFSAGILAFLMAIVGFKD